MVRATVILATVLTITTRGNAEQQERWTRRSEMVPRREISSQSDWNCLYCMYQKEQKQTGRRV